MFDCAANFDKNVFPDPLPRYRPTVVAKALKRLVFRMLQAYSIKSLFYVPVFHQHAGTVDIVTLSK